MKKLTYLSIGIIIGLIVLYFINNIDFGMIGNSIKEWVNKPIIETKVIDILLILWIFVIYKKLLN
jgi:hypothetical protein